MEKVSEDAPEIIPRSKQLQICQSADIDKDMPNVMFHRNNLSAASVNAHESVAQERGQSPTQVYAADSPRDPEELLSLMSLTESDSTVLKYASIVPQAIPDIDYPEEYCQIVPESVLNALYHCKRFLLFI